MQNCSNPLFCPVCKTELQRKDKQYVCEHQHSFDIAKQGYTNLWLHNASVSGDNKEMVHARQQFLAKGFYKPLQDKLIEIIASQKPNICVDAGCGEGYYTKQISELVDTYAFDVSKDALKIASRTDKQTNYFLSSIFSLPIKENSVDIITNIFAPFANEEFNRILKDEGCIIKVDPNMYHLYEMKEVLYDKPYVNELKVPDGYYIDKQEEVSFLMKLKQEDIMNLLTMTPYLFKTKKDKIEKLLTYTSLNVRASFIIYTLKRNVA